MLKDHIIKDGDVFRWSYRDHTYKHGEPNPYWCCSNIAIARGGILQDTYWGACSDGRSFKFGDDRLELQHLGNLDDFEIRNSYEAGYYDAADIMDLRHANDRSQFYIRKGAQRSREAMLAEARRRLAEAERQADTAKYRADLAREAVDSLTSGAALEAVLL